MKKLSFIFVLSLALGLTSLAQPCRALIVSHPVIELSANPGDTLKKTIRVENETKNDVTFYSSLYNFKASGVDGKPDLIPLPKEGEIDLASWVKIPAGPITLKPREAQEIEIEINVPVTADPGGHYAAVLWGSENPEQSGSSEVSIGWKTGHLLLLKVAGDIKESGSLVKFDIKNNARLFNQLPVEFVSELKNEGNVHLKPIGQIEIKNIFGQTSALLTYNKKGGNVLPKSSRVFDDVWSKTDKVDYGTGFLAGLKKEKDNFGLGYYRANAVIIYGANQEQVRSQVSFWVLPWRIMLLGSGVLLVIFSTLLFVAKRYNRYILKKAGLQTKK